MGIISHGATDVESLDIAVTLIPEHRIFQSIETQNPLNDREWNPQTEIGTPKR